MCPPAQVSAVELTEAANGLWPVERHRHCDQDTVLTPRSLEESLRAVLGPSQLMA